jgi:hypothetical protein
MATLTTLPKRVEPFGRSHFTTVDPDSAPAPEPQDLAQWPRKSLDVTPGRFAVSPYRPEIHLFVGVLLSR